VKDIVRKAAPIVFDRLPAPSSSEAHKISNDIDTSGDWFFRRKHRLPSHQNDFTDFQEWVSYLKSTLGKKNAGGTISRYFLIDEIDQTNLEVEITNAAKLFEPLMDRDWHASDEGTIPEPSTEPSKLAEPPANTAAFSKLLTEFLSVYGQERSGPFSLSDEIRKTMTELRGWIAQSSPVLSRPDIHVEISVGKGVWTKTPWIALLGNRETTTTQEGTYVVFLISEDLSVTYLTLNQGMTELRNRLKDKGAANEMLRVAEVVRPNIQELENIGFRLDNDIDLKSGSPIH
jgi:hypothetical protein